MYNTTWASKEANEAALSAVPELLVSPVSRDYAMQPENKQTNKTISTLKGNLPFG